MTETYAVYCIVDSDQPAPAGVAGLHAATVMNLPYRGIGAAVSALTGPVGDVAAGAVEHEAVVERFMEAHAVLPTRFPTILGSADAVVSMMARHYDSFNEGLCRLRGRVEFGVRVLWPDRALTGRDHPHDRKGPATSGRQYMQERYRQYRDRKARREQADQWGEILDKSLGQWVAARKAGDLVTERLAFDGVYLVDVAKQGDFRRAFADLAGADPGLKYLLSGPWPPYSFTETMD